MSIFTKIKSLLPVSSRSFHSLGHEIVGMKDDVKSSLRTVESIAAVIDGQQETIMRANDQLNALQNKLDAFEFQAMAILWDLYKKDGESLRDAKLRFFHSLPKASGSLREHQLELVDLLADFDELCSAHGIKYFLAIGTLLGALRHDGFVPWDDDVDVGVMREDIEKLISLVEHDDRFMITIAYDQYVFCKQIRFKRKDARDDDPFIDLFIYEYANCRTCDDLQRVKRLRDDLLDEFKELNGEYPDEYPLWECVKDGTVPSRRIQELYDKYRKLAYDKGLYSEKDKAASIIWSLENLSFGDPVHIIPIENFDAARIADFEGSSYPILGNSEMLLAQHYKDWLRIPDDIYTHFKHVELG